MARQDDGASETARTGWMTKRDAELFQVLARGLSEDEQEHMAASIRRANDAADEQVR